ILRSVYSYYLSAVDAEYRAALGELQKQREAYNSITDGIPEIMVMREMAERRPTYLLKRGNYDARADEVMPTVPEFLPALAADQPHNRLGLAQWLTDPKHPLTARVAVNRYWQIVFGTGLVRTPEDFGSQGRPPTHPQLLDWLAYDFMRNGWDVKRLVKTLVMSATYRQSSVATAAKLQADPENLWLSFAPSYRLPAEMLRDNVLAASGLLVDRLGGPPSKPYELAYAYDPSQPDQGDGVYRRSVYTYWKNSGPAPVMMTMDASKRDVCRMRRERTASPLQALVLLNGPQFVEAARALSATELARHGDDERAALAAVFRKLTSRQPNEKQLSMLWDLYESQRTAFQAQPAERDAYLANGRYVADEKLDRDRLAALSVVTNALFSYDGCVTKR
ncbi:MAG: DUF1553 domain-containing protein, partial [Planctomycetales bacterium]|nr:DUF1553 domain-containing protein [Planctomycetales bacterium]